MCAFFLFRRYNFDSVVRQAYIDILNGLNISSAIKHVFTKLGFNLCLSKNANIYIVSHIRTLFHSSFVVILAMVVPEAGFAYTPLLKCLCNVMSCEIQTCFTMLYYVLLVVWFIMPSAVQTAVNIAYKVARTITDLASMLQTPECLGTIEFDYMRITLLKSTARFNSLIHNHRYSYNMKLSTSGNILISNVVRLASDNLLCF